MKNRYFTGNHSFKFGVSALTGDYTEVVRQSGGNGIWFLFAADTDFFIAERILYTQNAKVKSSYQAAYLQDTWEAIPGFKLSFGVRFESQEQESSDGSTFLKFGMGDAIQPRIGIIYDPANDGKTKWSANFARYYEQIPQRMAMRQRGNEVYLDTYYQLTNYSRTGIGTYDPTVLDETDYSTPFTNIPIMKGIKLPRRDEFIVGVDHTLPSGWLVGLHAKRRLMTDPIEDFTPYDYDPLTGGAYVDPGTNAFGQAILGNPRPGTIRWTGSPTSADPGRAYEWDSVYPEATNKYTAVDLTADKKTERYYLSLSYTWSRLVGNYEGLVSASNGQEDANITASWDYPIYVGYGKLPIDRTHQVKFVGSYNWNVGPGSLTAGWFVNFRSGRPINQWTSVVDVLDGTTTEGVGIGNWTLPGSQIPTVDYGDYGDAIPADFRLGQFGRTPSTTKVDLRLEYAFKVGKVGILPSIDIFNAFNSRKVTSVEEAFTNRRGTAWDRWKTPTDWQAPRSFRFGVKVRF